MLPDIDSVLRVYDAAERLLAQAKLGELLEPREHVVEVERLRCLYRPAGEVRLVVLGESHVRVSDERFGRSGPAFFYNELYYTPWWRYLFLPAFAPAVERTGPAIRLRLLREMQAAGVWVLDASVISLSGYGKVNPMWSNRPFDALRREMIRISWEKHVQVQVEQVLKQQTRPVVCILGSIANLLPELPARGLIRLKCVGRSNSPVYRSEAYGFGTRVFVEAVRALNLEGLAPVNLA